MLEKITIKNYENHQESIIYPSPGVLIISGESNNGKSGVIRSTNWNIENKPLGYDSIRPWGLKPGSVTENVLQFSDVTIYKRRSDEIHEYQINNDKPLVAFGTSVPEEIKEAFNLSDFNIQTQHDKYFFIGESPGERARMLNEIAGLESIDKTQKNINSIISEVTTKIKLTKENIKENDEKLKKLSFVDSVEKLIVEIDSLQNKINLLQEENRKIEIITKQIVEVEDKINDCKNLIKVEKTLKEINTLIQQYNITIKESIAIEKIIGNIKKTEEKLDENRKYSIIEKQSWRLKNIVEEYLQLYEENKILEILVKNIKRTEEKLDEFYRWLKVEKYIIRLSHLLVEYDKWDKEDKLINQYITKINNTENKLIVKTEKLNKLIEKKKEMWGQLKFCPWCGKGEM